MLDEDKIEILEMTLSRLSPDDRDRPLVLATLCSELALGTPLARRQALAEEALVLAVGSGDDAIIVRVLNSIYYALQVPALLEQSMVRAADAAGIPAALIPLRLNCRNRLGDPTYAVDTPGFHVDKVIGEVFGLTVRARNVGRHACWFGLSRVRRPISSTRSSIRATAAVYGSRYFSSPVIR